MKAKNLQFVSLFLVLTTLHALGQENVNATVSKNANNVSVSTDKTYILLYEEPMEGQITFKDKTFAKAKLNINLLSDDILFLDNNTGTLLPLANQKDVNFFSIGKDLFFNTSYGLIQVIANIKDIQLGIARGFSTKDVKKQGAYGISSSIASTQQVTSISGTDIDIPIFTSLTLQQKVDLGYYEKFYLIFKGKFKNANIKNFSKVFGLNKKELEEFCKKEDLDLSSKNDIIKLMNFCTAR